MRVERAFVAVQALSVSLQELKPSTTTHTSPPAAISAP